MSLFSEMMDEAGAKDKRIEELTAALQSISDKYDARSELYTSDAECAAGLADVAKAALGDTGKD